MKISLFISLYLVSAISYCQELVIFGESYPVKIEIGISKKAVKSPDAVINLKSGEKIFANSETTKLKVGSEDIKTFGSHSSAILLKLSPTQNKKDLKPDSARVENNYNRVVPNYFALVIGIDTYQHASSSLINLYNPVKDAVLLENVLLEKYVFSKEKTLLLKNPTRAEIIKAFEDFSSKLKSSDNLLIFYAGHGYWDEKLKLGYWLPSDCKTEDKSNWIPNSTIRDYIGAIQSKHILLISDACFSGSIFKLREVTTEINQYGVSKIYQLPSRKAMTSGTLTTVPDESKFMKYLVQRLHENTNDYLTTRQLFFSLETAVLNNTNTVPQLGVIQDTGDEGGDFVFIKKN